MKQRRADLSGLDKVLFFLAKSRIWILNILAFGVIVTGTLLLWIGKPLGAVMFLAMIGLVGSAFLSAWAEEVEKKG